MSEKVLDAENWKVEAEGVVRDVEKHVRQIAVVGGTDQCVFFDITTIEGERFRIELSGHGFRVATDEVDEEYFETPYSLLNQLSPAFRESFGNELIRKLSSLSRGQNHE